MGGPGGGNGRVRPGRQQRCRSMRGYVGSGSRCCAGTLDSEPIRTSWRMLSSGPRHVVVSTTTGAASRLLVLRPGRCGVVGDRDDAAGSAVGCCAPGGRCARGIRRPCWRCRPAAGLLPDSLRSRAVTAGRDTPPARWNGTGERSTWAAANGPGSTWGLGESPPPISPQSGRQWGRFGSSFGRPRRPARRRPRSSLGLPARDKLGRERPTPGEGVVCNTPPSARRASVVFWGGLSRPIPLRCSDSGWTLTDEKIQ